MLPTPWFRAGWVVLAVAALIWEALALFDPEKGDTATEQIRWLLQWPPTWWVGAGLLFWFCDHFLAHDYVFEHIFRR